MALEALQQKQRYSNEEIAYRLYDLISLENISKSDKKILAYIAIEYFRKIPLPEIFDEDDKRRMEDQRAVEGGRMSGTMIGGELLSWENYGRVFQKEDSYKASQISARIAKRDEISKKIKELEKIVDEVE